LNNIGLN